MPPAAIRRPLTVAAWLVLCGLGLALSPVLLVLAGLAGALSRDRRPVIFARLLIVYFAHELATLLACGVLWLASGAGRFIGRRPFRGLHWALLRWYVHGITERALSILQITVAPDHPPEAVRALEADGPLLAFSRHAGPGDTVLITDQLFCDFDRRPSVVFKEALAIDPSIDLLAHRLPHAVLDTSDRDECEIEITRVTRELGRRGVLLLFPEGANFTQERRRAALRKLRRKGRRREAGEAVQMPNVLPPHPTGVQSALAANPAADVIFAAHTGLGLAAYPGQLWRHMPVGQTLRTRLWHVPAHEIPQDPDQQTEWLYDWWKRIDEWIEAQPGG
jgi:1-acyl-sn-glycerol-3-phosphate acyltransferase